MGYGGMGNGAGGMGHWRQLNVKALFYLAPMLCVGALISEAPPPFSVQEAEPPDMHFQPEAGNEVLKGFGLKLTRMGMGEPLRCGGFLRCSKWRHGALVFLLPIAYCLLPIPYPLSPIP